MAAAYATELGYHGYNNYGYNHGYSNSYDLYDSYNNYGYDGYNSYGYNSYNGPAVHSVHKRAIFLPPLIASLGGNFIKTGVKKAALFPIGK